MNKHPLPDGFLLLSSVFNGLIDLKYTGNDNLIGRPLRGYAPNGSAILTEPAALSLGKILAHLARPEVKKELRLEDPSLLIWEAYRPLQAGEDFWEWTLNDDMGTKEAYYPNIDKKFFFEQGYIARHSAHSRGSTVDLTIIDKANGKVHAIDMGTPFDFMDVLSQPANQSVTPTAYRHRQFLKQLMNDFGWEGINQEWWHFTFQAEPFPDTYFDFPVVNYEK